MWTRRALLQRAGMVAGAASLLRGKLLRAQHSMAMPAASTHRARTLAAGSLQPFVDELQLPVLQHSIERRSDTKLGATNAAYYRVPARSITAKLHRDLPQTQLWSYSGSAAPALFDVRSNAGTLVEWANDLPAKHILPIDVPMPGTEHSPQMEGMQSAPLTRIITHLHGARVPSISDGYPEDWFGPGHSRMSFYPNEQDAAALWMHDHAMGTGRFNVLAGLAGWYIIRDEAEDALNLPSGQYELPLMLTDRAFTPEGQIYYPNPPDEGTWTPEYIGDFALVNGTVQPFCRVQPRLYRLRIVNAANARFFALALTGGVEFHVIGMDQGLLPAPVTTQRLVLAPAERADILVDFSTARGRSIELHSDGLQVMQFRVDSEPAQTTSRMSTSLRPVQRIAESTAARTRRLTLNEFNADNGEAMVMLLNRAHWADPVTEIVKLGTTEIWELLNLTGDTHPIHLHMVRFQILDRQSFSDYEYLADDAFVPSGQRIPPAAHERGWKDVVQCPPYTVTRIAVPFNGYAGRYLWHCHILEHEANDMMRPYDVVA